MIIIVILDNGLEGLDFIDQALFKVWVALIGYDLDDQDMPGERSSYGFIGLEWASAVALLFSFFKFYIIEGGIWVLLVISGFGILVNICFD